MSIRKRKIERRPASLGEPVYVGANVSNNHFADHGPFRRQFSRMERRPHLSGSDQLMSSGVGRHTARTRSRSPDQMASFNSSAIVSAATG